MDKALKVSSFQFLLNTTRKKIDEYISASIEQAKADGYNKGYADGVKSQREDQIGEDNIPIHNIESLPTKALFNAINPDGYKQSDYSAIWPILFATDVDAGEAEVNYPYVVYGKGDKVIVECSDEPTQTITPYKEAFAIFCLTPNKTYHWTMYKGTTVLKSGDFKTIGRVRWMKTPDTKYPHNLRDLGSTEELGKAIKFGRLYRGEHPDKIESGSTDHIYLRDQLGITVQMNLRDKTKEPARDDLFETTYSYNIPAYAAAITGSTSSRALFKSAFVAIVNELEKGHNILINCWQGRDRTGTMCWAIQALCGMKAGYCEAHWELSSFDRCENSKKWNWEEASNGELRTFIGKLETLYGKDPYTQAYRLLTEKIGVPKERIEKLKEIMN